MSDWLDIRYFKSNEFDSPDAIGSGREMNLGFVLKLDHLRELFGKPLVVSSGYRTKARNKAVGGVADSSHTNGKAADLVCTSSADRYRLVALALQMGFKRIGIAKTFIHLDMDETLPQGVIWLY